MDQQEIFNKVADHLLTQNEVSKTGHSCLYRHGHLKCAIGALIPDEVYSPDMEGKSPPTLIDTHSAVLPKDVFNPKNRRLLQSLQDVHDYNPPERWKGKLIELSVEYGLDYSSVLGGS